MKTNGVKPVKLISKITVVASASAVFYGCVPTLPPVVTTPTQLGLYYQHATSSTNNSTSIERWLPVTDQVEVLLPQAGGSFGTYVIDSMQPFGSNLILWAPLLTLQSRYVIVPDSNDHKPRQLNTYWETPAGTNGGGFWTEWAPDGKYIGMQIDDEVIVTAPDGSGKKTIGLVNGFNNPQDSYPTWSPDGSKLAYTTAPDNLEIADMTSGEKVSIRPPGALPTMYLQPQWMADNHHLLMFVTDDAEEDSRHTYIFDANNPDSIQEYLKTYSPNPELWSPAGDRRIEVANTDTGKIYTLSFTDNCSAVELLGTTEEDEFVTDFMPAWSGDGERLAYVKDTNGNGDAEVVVASKDGATLQTYSGFAVPEDATLSWSPDNLTLLVVTNSFAYQGGVTRGTVINTDNGLIQTLFDNEPPQSRPALVAIDWSPNSQYFALRTRPYDAWTNANARLFDTLHPDAVAQEFATNGVMWSPDSNYLAISTLSEIEGDGCLLSVIKFEDGAQSTIPVAGTTSCRIEWSNPTAH